MDECRNFKSKRFNFTDILLASLLSLIITTQGYKYLFNVCRYSNLKDFYTGASIYIDHNKYLDVYIYFLYLAAFFIFIFLVSFLRKIISKTLKTDVEGIKRGKSKEKCKVAAKEEQKTAADKNEKVYARIKELPKVIQKIKTFLSHCKLPAAAIKKSAVKYQYLCLICFVFLHPFDGILYPKIALIILILIGAGMFDIRKRSKNTEFSPFAISALVFVLLFAAYNISFAPPDDHHFGEKFAAFLMHNNFNLEYYKDIMLVHGYIDVIPSWIGAYLFDTNGIYGYCLGEIFFKNALFILITLSAAYIFKKHLLYTAPLLLLKLPTIAYLFILSYLLMLKKEIINKPQFSLPLYIIFSVIFTLIWTTIGTFWSLAALPFAVFAIYKTAKLRKDLKGRNSVLKQLILPLLSIVILCLLFGKTYIEYFKIMPYYVQGNLFAFGTKFEDLSFYFPKYLNFFYKTFALFFVPVLILKLCMEIKNKSADKIEKILFLLFVILLPLVSQPYTACRIDAELMRRFEYISAPYIFIVLPYFLYKFSNRNHKIIFNIILIFALFSSVFNLPQKFEKIKAEDVQRKSTLYNTGRINLKREEEKRLNDLKTFVYKEENNKSFLDLTNGGMLYLYLNKKIPVQYTSFYNSISSAQSDISAERLRKNPPDIILVNSKFNIHDNIYPSLRVNSIYRQILLDRFYKFEEYNGNIFIVKTENENMYSKEELETLDYILSNNNLNFLPEVWAKSMNTLPLTKINPSFYGYIQDNSVIIKFLNTKNQKDIDFLYIDISVPAKFRLSVNNSSAVLKCKSRTGKILVPLDNFPSWLLNEDLKEITIEIETTEIKNPNIEFYNKINKP